MHIASQASKSRAFTIIEMLITVAVLVIVMGMMVSLARHVRDRSAQQLTRALLQECDRLMSQYLQNNGGTLPAVKPLLPAQPPPNYQEDAVLAQAAKQNNTEYLQALRSDYAARHREQGPQADPFASQPITIYDHDPADPANVSLRDAWGSAIVFMPGQHSLIGLAPSRERRDQYFFFSAGPDRKYLTRDDNVYSYETLARPR